jgi:hypothetical protein
MSSYFDADNALSKILTDAAPVIAAEFAQLDNTPWHVQASRADADNLHPVMRVVLARESDGMAVALYVDRHAKRVTCSPSLPLMPSLSGSGGYSLLREFLPYSATPPDCDAAAAITRITDKPEAVARDFYKRSVTPYAELYPLVVAKVAERAEGWRALRETADRLAAEHGGKVSDTNRGNTFYVYFAEAAMPSLEVGYGGSVRTSHALSMSEAVAGALIKAIRADSSK